MISLRVVFPSSTELEIFNQIHDQKLHVVRPWRRRRSGPLDPQVDRKIASSDFAQAPRPEASPIEPTTCSFWPGSAAKKGPF